jgi:hypothetical protein
MFLDGLDRKNDRVRFWDIIYTRKEKKEQEHTTDNGKHENKIRANMKKNKMSQKTTSSRRFMSQWTQPTFYGQ